ncbi:MAG: protoporphyrinogen oxidase [Acidobacteriota bacterium]|nr:protoporphyrinogen oxidase [Acidobacteriota bacterium]
MKRIAIVGGGISGLSAAFALEQKRQRGIACEYVLFEASSRLGGVIQTEEIEGCVVEAGPDSFLTEKPWASRLCQQLGIGDQLMGSSDSLRKTYIVVNQKLVPLPDGLMFMVPTKLLPTALSPLFSVGTKLRVLKELFYRPHKAEYDESVASFIERHYGSAMVERLADPLLAGVYGGEASQLSVRAVLPRFADMEAKHGSIGRGMISSRRKMVRSGGTAPKPIFTSLRKGMGQVVDAIEQQLAKQSVRKNTAVQAVQFRANAWNLTSNLGTETFDGLILALPSHQAANLIEGSNQRLSQELGAIAYSSSITVVLGYGNDVRSALPAGFGFLVPQSENRKILATTFVHNKFLYRAPSDKALLRCFLGGPRGESLLKSSEEEIVAGVRQDLRDILGISTEPHFVRVYKWKHAMAQYNVGHPERRARIESLLQPHVNLALAGNAYDGIGIPDCVRAGEGAALRILNAVGLRHAIAT